MGSNQAAGQRLSVRSFHAVKWNYIGVAARVVSQVLVQILMARMLGPDLFGLFALAFLVVGLGSIVAEMGLGAALVQKKEISELDVRHVYTLAGCIGLVLAASTFFAAPLFAQLFGDERVIAVLRALAPAFVLQGLSVTPIALLKRNLEFKRIQVALVGSYVFGFLVVGLGLAYVGAGIWSLVAAWLAQAAMLAIVCFSMHRHSLLPLLVGGDSSLRSYGFRVLLTNLCNWAVENLDNFLVGRFFGAKALGVYSVSYNLVRAPATHLVTSLQTALFAAASRAQDNEAGLKRAYLVAVSGVSLAAIPVFVGIAAIAPTFVEAVLGAKWSGADLVLRPLALAMVAHTLMAVAGPVLWGKGVVGVELTIQAFTAVVLVLVLLLASRQSVEVMAWMVLAVYVLRFLAITVALLRRLHIRAGALLRAIRGGMTAACVIGPAMWALDAYFIHQTAPIRLIADIALAATLLAVFVIGFPRIALSREIRQMLRGMSSTLPGVAWLLTRVSVVRGPGEQEPEAC